MKNLKRVSLIFLIFLTLFSVKVFSGYDIGELTEDDPLYYSRNSGEEKNDDGIMLLSLDDQENISSIISKFEDGTAATGIDVSAWQEDIDWQQVANSGVKFAIIRCGYRTGTEGKILEDKYFRKNIEGAINNGIYVGVYFYSTAINEGEAIEEANATLEMIKDYDIKYFVAYDFETFYEEHKNYRSYGLSLDQVNKNAEAFLSTIRNSGYTAVMYSNIDCIKNRWDMNKYSSYDLWVANWYVNKPNYSRYNIWQYSDKGGVPGIKGYVDIDIDYTYFFKHNNVDISPYLFNSTYYADCYPDLKAVFGYDEASLRNHFEQFGKKEGRTGSPIFDPKYYSNKYPDIKNAFGSNYSAMFDHFITFGAVEGRQGSKYLDSKYYLKNYNDLLRTFYSSKTKAIEHFATFGVNEGRVGSSDFNSVNYKNSTSPYYRKNIGNNYLKYMALDYGGSPITDNNIDISRYMFDAKYYYDKYEDLRVAIGWNEEALRQHFENFGKREGRIASRIFDPIYYVNSYPDIKNAFRNDYVSIYNHFIEYGCFEGRSGSEELQVKKYLGNYIDLQEAFGTYYTKAIEHYVVCGVNEGRKGN